MAFIAIRRGLDFNNSVTDKPAQLDRAQSEQPKVMLETTLLALVYDIFLT